MANRLSLILVVLLGWTWSSHAETVQFAILNGKIVTCTEAVKFRDGRLAQEMTVFLDAYDADKADRQRAVRERFQRHIKALDEAWAKTEPANRDAVIANSIGLVLSIIGSVVGEKVASKPGISESDKQAARILADRSAATTGILTSAGLTKDVNPADVIGLPIAVIGAIGTPAIGGAALAFGIGSGVIGLGAAGYDYYLDARDYRTQLSSFKQALDKLIDKSLDLKLADFNRIKNEIDTKCSKH